MYFFPKFLTQKFVKMGKFFMPWENQISVHLKSSFKPYLNWILLRTDITRPDEYCNCLFMLTDALFVCLFLSLINIAAAIDLYLGNVPLNQKRQILILISTNQNFVFRFNGFSPKIWLKIVFNCSKKGLKRITSSKINSKNFFLKQ